MRALVTLELTSLDTEKLRVHRSAFVAELPTILTEIESRWNVRPPEGVDREGLQALQRIVRGLAYASASLGYVALSDTAQLLEQLLGIAASRAAISDVERDRIDALLTALFGEGALCGVESVEARSAAPDRFRESRLVFLLQDDPTQHLALHIGHHGYTVRMFSQVVSLLQALAESTPSAVILDTYLPDGTPMPPEAMAEIRQVSDAPLIFVAARTDLEARLHAARLGGVGFFPRPVNVGALMDRLEGLTVALTEGPGRVAIVEPDPGLARYYEVSMQAAGLLTLHVAQPFKEMAALIEFRPDVVLLDVDALGDGSLDAAMAFRQQTELVASSILLLSADASEARQVQAMGVGVEGLLPRLAPGEHLAKAAIGSVSRNRAVRALLARDVLTGLHNHRAIVDLLDVELARADREMEPMTFVSLNIDGLASINSRHGHRAGDRAIRALGELLEKRLRRTDVIGRYGAGRFALVLPNTDALEASRVMEDVRARFSRVMHRADRADGEAFSATLSTGLAAYPHYSDAVALRQAADRALYEAKERGGNRLIVRSRRGSRGRRVLVVDDDHAITRLLEMALEQHGYEVISANDGLRGLELARRERPDLVLTDLLLPYQSGFDLVSRVKQDERLASVPVLVMTGVYRKVKYRVECAKAGADAFFEKPFNLPDLLAAIDQRLQHVAPEEPAPETGPDEATASDRPLAAAE